MKKETLSTSKLILFFVVITYFIAFTISTVKILSGEGDLYSYLAFVGTATTTALGFYYWKAKNENVNKYQRGKINARYDQRGAGLFSEEDPGSEYESIEEPLDDNTGPDDGAIY